MKKTLSILLLTIFVTLFFSGCVKKTPRAEGKLNIVTTVGMIANVVENIGGPNVKVTALMGPGVDPHLYKASSGDTAKLTNADIIFYGGLHLEGKMVDIFQDLSKRKVVVAVSKDIPKEKLLISKQLSNDQNILIFDPHIWFDVSLWTEAAKTIQKTLEEHDAKNAPAYRQNAEIYIKELETLHSWTKEQISIIPRPQRVLITSHDAFNYFGRAYDIEVIGIQGISTAADFGLKDLERVIDIIISRNIKAIFVESSVPRKSIEAVQEGVRAKGKNVIIGGQLFSDAMGDKNTPEGNYIGMVRYNVNTITDNLK